MDDDEPLLPFDDLVRWSKGELPREWFGERIAILQRRAARFAADVEALRESDPETYKRLNKPF